VFEVVLNFFIGVLGIAVGAFITWRVSKHYYERAGRELRDESEALRGLVGMILRAMQNAGLAKIKRDEKGKMTLLVIDLKGKGVI
jgi:hypothetical protein